MDVKLQNAYSQVLLDNFLAVVKQNILFQAQLETLKSEIEEANETKRKIQELSNSNVELQKSLLEKEKLINSSTVEKDRIINALTVERNALKNDLNSKSSEVSNLNSIVQEKNRLQQAVNDYMRQLNDTKNELMRAKSESQDVLIRNNTRLDELTKYIEKLELELPANKLKKVKTNGSAVISEKVIQTETPDSGVRSGGTF
jgi:myosin heavy subunit